MQTAPELRTANKQLLEECLADMKRRRRSAGTLTTYRFILTPFIEWADAQDRSVLDFRRVDVETYIRDYDLTFEAKWGRLPEPSTVRNVIVGIASFYRFCEAFEMIARNPARHVEPPAQKKLPIQWLTDAECDSMWGALRSPQERIVFPLLLETGMRQGEARSLLNEDVSLETGEIRIRDSKTVNGIRTIYISDVLAPWIRRWKIWQEQEGLTHPKLPFLTTCKGNSMPAQQIWETVKRIAKRAGVRLDPSKHQGTTISPHALRRTWATRRYAESVDPRAIAKWLGHSGTTTLERSYADYTDQQMRQSVLGW